MGTNDNFGQTWDDARKSALVAQIVSGKLSVKEACERHELSAETIQEWVRVFRRTTLQALDDHLRQTFLIQGADAASLGSAEYTGTLADIPLADLIQTFQMGAKDGVIAVTCDGRRSRIWCDKGEIVDAESGRLRGEAAVYRILSFERGQVFADFRGEPRERSVEIPGNLLLLEAARRMDESARLLDRLGGLRCVFRAARHEPAREASPAERAVLGSCDGRRDLAALLEQSELGDLETLEVVLALLQRGALVRDDDASAGGAALVVSQELPTSLASVDILGSMVSLSPLAASHRPARRRRRGAALALAAGALALAGVAWGAARWRGAPEPQPAAAVVRAAPPVAAREPGSFRVDTLVEPPHAELWLDGLKVGVGRLQRELPRDGQAHSLRVLAEGYAPTTLLFADAPPPGRITLETLSAPAPREPPAAQAPPRTPPPPAVPRARRPSVAARAPERAKPAERAEAAPAPPAPPSAPRVQIIEPTTPVVRVIE